LTQTASWRLFQTLRKGTQAKYMALHTKR